MKAFSSALLLLSAGLWAQDLPPAVSTPAVVTHTDHLDFPAGGLLKLENSTGELTIEGWDQPGMEITTINPEPDRVKITSSLKGSDVVVQTDFPHRLSFPGIGRLHGAPTNIHPEYRIKVPRTARLSVAHNEGEVHIENISGAIDVKSRQGLITVHMVDPGPLEIHAHSLAGNVDSDFSGAFRRRVLLGHDFTAANSSAAQKLDLDIGYGDIVILNLHKTSLPAPVSPFLNQ